MNGHRSRPYIKHVDSGTAPWSKRQTTSASCRSCARRTSEPSEQRRLAELQFPRSASCNSRSRTHGIPPLGQVLCRETSLLPHWLDLSFHNFQIECSFGPHQHAQELGQLTRSTCNPQCQSQSMIRLANKFRFTITI